MDLLEQARHRLFSQAKVPSSLGALETIALEMVRVQKTLDISIADPYLILCAADHGAVCSEITLSSADITRSQCLNFASGNGSCAIACQQNNVGFRMLDLGILKPLPPDSAIQDCRIAAGTSDFFKGNAMTEDQLQRAMKAGSDAVSALPPDCNTVVFGEMGIGNSSSAILLAAALSGKKLDPFFDCGNLDSSRIAIRKYTALCKALESFKPSTPQEAFIRFGGFEIAAIAGGMIQASKKGLAILVDGLITASSLLFASKIYPDTINHCIAAHKSSNRGYMAIINETGLVPMLDFGMAPGEGTGAVSAIPLFRESCALFCQMKSFEKAAVSCVYTRPLSYDFALGTTSFIIADELVPNVEYLKDKVQDVELVLFESEETSNFPDPATISALKSIADENNLTYTVHLPYDVSLGTDSQIAVSQTVKAINLTRNLPVHAYVLHLMPEHELKYPAENIPLWQHHCLTNVRSILNLTGIPSRLLCIENLSYDMSFAWPVIEALDTGTTLDVGHMWKYGYYSSDLVRLMLERSRVIHLHGVDSTGRDHIGLEKLDRTLLRTFLHDFSLYARKRTQVMTLEVFSKHDLESSIAILKEELK